MLLCAALLSLFLPGLLRAQVCPQTTFLGNYPSKDAPNSEDWVNGKVQGVAHDENSWFITTQFWLIKFPVSFDLNTNFVWPPPPGILYTTYPVDGYTYFSDLDQVNGLLFAGMTGPGRKSIAVFRASDLKYLGLKVTVQDDVPWVAYDPLTNLLYSSDSEHPVDELYRYTVDFGALEGLFDAQAPDDGIVSSAIVYYDKVTLYEADGSPLNPPFAKHIQGGVFTPWGDLYLASGSNEIDFNGARMGIHLFGSDFRIKDESVNSCTYPCFECKFNPNFDDWQEPEGLDWWNRDIGTASPHISGQLHVLLYDYQLIGPNAWHFKHYDVDYWCADDNDSDGDGLSDLDEIYVYETSVWVADTDQDGFPDGEEVAKGSNPKDPLSIPNTPPVADAGLDQTVQVGADCTASVTLNGTGSTDPDGDQLTFTWTGSFGTLNGATPTVTLTLGTYNITLTVNDGKGGIASDSVSITVKDSTSPTIIMTVSPDILWPPNHKMVPITLTVNATDNCGPTITINLKSIIMNEGQETNTYDPAYDDTTGDGNTLNDIQVDANGNIYLRAERSGGGNGRVYKITYSATDASGNTSSAEATVTVPHDQ